MSKADAWQIASCWLAAMLLQACAGAASTRWIIDERNQEIAQLRKVHIVSVLLPPAEGDLAARFGTATVYEAEDLTLHMYKLNFEQLKLLHGETRSAAGHKEEKDSGAFCEGSECLFVPLALPVLVMSLPAGVVDLAVAENKRAKHIEALSGSLAVFAYDADGDYRWHGCCFAPWLMENRQLFPTRFPYSDTIAGSVHDQPQSYREDFHVLTCNAAKMGDDVSQYALFRRFNRTVPDPVQTYYWARVVGQASGTVDRSQYFDWVEASLPQAELDAGEVYFASQPLETVNCREVANMLIEAEDLASEGPNIVRRTGSAETTVMTLEDAEMAERERRVELSLPIDCPGAKAGKILPQWYIYRTVKAAVPDPVHRYYWARVIKENPLGGSYTIAVAEFERSVTADIITAGEKYYRTHPLESLDCAPFVAMLVGARQAALE